MLKLVLIPVAGFIFARAKKLPDNVITLFSDILLMICYPAMVLEVFAQRDMWGLWRESISVVIVCGAAAVTLFLLGKFFLFRNHGQEPLLTFMLGSSCVTYIGIPVSEIMLGPYGLKVAILYGLVTDIFCWYLFYPFFLVGKKRVSLSRLLLNPCIVCMLAGLIFSLSGAAMPAPAAEALSALSACVSPLALLILGFTLANKDLGLIVRNLWALRFSACKVLLIPLLCLPLIMTLTDPVTALALLTLIACPTALLSVIWARGWGWDVSLATDCFINSTLLFFLIALQLIYMLKNIVMKL
ncbi:MAG: AEC family transporter [Clostridiales bacterium]|jgi:predicted permease|nr:AEC family transporter [Clostridiales bacterium]